MIKYEFVDPRVVAQCENTKKRLCFLTNGGFGRRPSSMIDIAKHPEQCIFILLAIDTTKNLIIGWCSLTPYSNSITAALFPPGAKNKRTVINTYVATNYRKNGIGKALVSKMCAQHKRAEHTLSNVIYCYYDHSDSGKKMYDTVNKELKQKALYDF